MTIDTKEARRDALNYGGLSSGYVDQLCDEIDSLRAQAATVRAEALREAAREVEKRCAPDGLGEILAGYIEALIDKETVT